MPKPTFDQFKDAEAFLANPVAMDTLASATSKREATTSTYYDNFTPEQQAYDPEGFKGKIDRVKQEDSRIMTTNTNGQVDPQIDPAKAMLPLPEEERAKLDSELNEEVTDAKDSGELYAKQDDPESLLDPARKQALDEQATAEGFAAREFTAEYAGTQGIEEVNKSGETLPADAEAAVNRLKQDIDQDNYFKEAPFIMATRKGEVDANRQQKLAEAQYAFDKGYYSMAKKIAENSATPDQGIQDTINPVEMLAPNFAVMRMLGASKAAYQSAVATFPLEFAFSYGLEDTGFTAEHPILGLAAEMTVGVITGTAGEAAFRRMGAKAPKPLTSESRKTFGTVINAASSPTPMIRTKRGVFYADSLSTPVSKAFKATDPLEPTVASAGKGGVSAEALATKASANADPKPPAAGVTPVLKEAEAPIDVEAMAKRHEERLVLLAKTADEEVVRMGNSVSAPEIISQGMNNEARLDAVAHEIVENHIAQGLITPNAESVASIEVAATAGFNRHPIGRTLVEKQAHLEGEKIRKAIDLQEVSSPVVSRVLAKTSENIVARAEVMSTSANMPQSVADAVEHSRAAADAISKTIKAASENPFNTAVRVSTPITDAVREKLRKATVVEYYGQVPKNFDSKATLNSLVRAMAKGDGVKTDPASIKKYTDLASAHFTKARKAGQHGEDFLNDLKARFDHEVKQASKANKVLTADDRVSLWLDTEAKLGAEYKALVDEAVELRVQEGAELVPGSRSFYLKGEVESTDPKFAYGTPGSVEDARVGSGLAQKARQKAITAEADKIRKEVYGPEVKLTAAQKAAKGKELGEENLAKWVAEQEQSGILGAKARAATKALFDQKVKEAEAAGTEPDLKAIGQAARDEVKKRFAADFKNKLDVATAKHNVDPSNRRYRAKDWDPTAVDNIVSDEGTFNFQVDAKRPTGEAPKTPVVASKTYPESLSFKYESFATLNQVRSSLRAAFDALTSAQRSSTGGKGKLPLAESFKKDLTVYSKAKGKKITFKALSEDDIDQTAKLYGWGPHKLSTHTGIDKKTGTAYSTFADEINFGKEQYKIKVSEDPEYYDKQMALPREEQDMYAMAQNTANKAYREQRVKFLRKAMGLPADAKESVVYKALDPAFALSKQIGQDVASLQGFADQEKAKRTLIALADMLGGTDYLPQLNKMIASAARQKGMREYFGDTRTPKEWAIEDAAIKEIYAYQKYGTNVEITDARIKFLAKDEGISEAEAEAIYRDSVMGDSAEDLENLNPGQVETDVLKLAEEEGLTYSEALQKYTDDELTYRSENADDVYVNEDGEIEDMVGASEISEELGTGAQITTLTPKGKRTPPPPAEQRSHIDFVEEVEIRMGTRFDDPSFSPSAYGGTGKYNLLKINSVEDVHRSFKAYDVATYFDDGTRSGILKNELEVETPASIKARFGITPSPVHDQTTLNVMTAMLEDQEAQLITYAKQMADRPGDRVMALTLSKMRSVHRTTLTALEQGKTGEDAWYSFKGMNLAANSDRELSEKIQRIVSAKPEMLDDAEVFGQMLTDIVRKDKSKASAFIARHSALDEQVGRSKNYYEMYAKKAQLQKQLKEAC